MQGWMPGEILSMTAQAADRLIAAGSGDDALLYLWLLKSGGEYDAVRAAHALGWDAGRCDESFRRLAGQGLADEGRRAAPPAPVPAEPPEYSAADIKRELENSGSLFPGLVQEVQRKLGKVLSTADLKTLYAIYDFTGLPAEVILLVVSWCTEEARRKYGEGRTPRLPQIEKEARRWKERGVDTLETAEPYLKRLSALRDRTAQVMALLDIRDRPAVAREREYIAAWVDMGFPDESIREAYERTVLKKQSLNWAYMNSILCSWHKKGLHTPEQITTGDSPVRARNAARGRPGAGATAPQPITRREADEQIRQDMDWVRKFVKEHSGEGT